MSVHETSLFFRGKSDRNVMIALLEGAEGAMGVVVYGNQEKRSRRVGPVCRALQRIDQAAVGRAGSTLKKPALSLASRVVLAGRYFFISSFFVVSFTFAFPILTDTT